MFQLKKLLNLVFIIFILIIPQSCKSCLPQGSDTKELKKLVNVLSVIQKDYVDEDKIDNQKLINGAIKGMLEALGDPHSMYLPNEFMQDMNTTSHGNYGGVGMIITSKDNNIVVITPMEGSPAYKKGIKTGDIIVSVNGENLAGLTVEDAANKLRGEAGTPVKLEVMRKTQSFEVELKRAIIDLPSVKQAIIKDNYGYLRIVQFAGTTSKHVKDALIEFKNKNVKGIIVDLRYNPGGLLSQAIDIANCFISEGVIVSTKGRNPNDTAIYKASKMNAIVDKNIPVIVLIDQGSASASEIFAGAIRDDKRGILIGEKSYGKGSVQTIYPLDAKDGFKLTIAKYYTPADICIDGIGLKPDIEIKEPELTDKEKETLKKLLYEDKAVDKLIKDKYPTDAEIEQDIDKLINQGYILPRRYLKRMIKNAAELTEEKKSIYDLELDIPLSKSIEVFEKGLLEQKEDGFYLKTNEIKDLTNDINWK